MSGQNFSYINQFKRNGHAPLPKSQPEHKTEWISNGPYQFEYITKFFTNFWHIELLKDTLRKYPKKREAESLFMKKLTIPLGVDDEHPFGNPPQKYSPPISGGGWFISQAERQFFKNWVKNIVSMA